jgi:hypothetical protein
MLQKKQEFCDFCEKCGEKGSDVFLFPTFLGFYSASISSIPDVLRDFAG